MPTTSEIFEAAALLDQLTDNQSETFETSAARRLINIVPLTRKPSWFYLKSSWTSEGSSMVGAAAGGSRGGSARIPGQSEAGFTVGDDQTVRIGGYVLRHQTGRMTISHFLGGEDESRSCQLIYSYPDNPTELLWYQPRSVRIFGVRLAVEQYVHWKSPAS